MEDLKMENARDLYEAVLAHLKSEHKDIVLDLFRVQFIDSSGIGMLIKSADKIREAGQGVYLIGLNKSLSSVFRLTGLLKYFHVLEEHEAKNKFPDLFAK